MRCAGVLEAGSYALNSNKGKKERIGRLMMMHANNREDIKVAFAGDIVAIGGLKDIVTGALSVICILCSLNNSACFPWAHTILCSCGKEYVGCC